MSKPYVSNLISHKYDTALDFHVTMYDNLPYQRDSDYCNIEKVAMTSGKVIKFYLAQHSAEKVVIDNKDETIEEYLMELKLKQQRQIEANRELPAVENSDEVTDKQIQTLLNDRDENESSVTDEFQEEDPLANSVNAFADVEDW